LTPFVLDASMTMAWCFADESTSYSSTVLDSLRSARAVAPAIWPVEVANVLALAVRHDRITLAESVRLANLIKALSIEVEGQTLPHVLDAVLPLAHGQRLTAYDASYLELAIRLALPIATLDEHLKNSARRLGVPLV